MSISYRKLKRHFRHIGDGNWSSKGQVRTFYCDVCGGQYKRAWLSYEDCDRHLKAIPNHTRFKTLCSAECWDLYSINPLAYADNYAL